MTVLVRHNRLDPALRRRVLGPVPGGRNWAVDGRHDLPLWGCEHGDPYDGRDGLLRLRCRRTGGGHVSRITAERLEEAGCRLWLGWVDSYGLCGPWEPVTASELADRLAANPQRVSREEGWELPIPPYPVIYVAGHRGGTGPLPARKEVAR